MRLCNKVKMMIETRERRESFRPYCRPYSNPSNLSHDISVLASEGCI